MQEQISLLDRFQKVPAGYGEVSFFWWVGDTLTKEKLRWHLEQVKDHHISGIQINYAHSDTGGRSYGLTLESDPPLFSDNWWELFGWFMKEAQKYGISVSLSDYTLGTPGQGWYMDEIIEKNPELIGKQLKECSEVVEGTIEWNVPDNLISLVAYPIEDTGLGEGIDFTGEVYESCLKKDMNKGKYKLIGVYYEEVTYSVDPMNQRLGEEMNKAFYNKFIERFPEEGGKGLNFFFSDELNFNIRGDLWNEEFATNFKEVKGYDITPYLAAIFEDIGDITQKIRLDYYDMIVRLSEEAYFKPVYEWHQSRGMTFGCDHGGRGKDITEFGDYFRTMKWNQGPGNDQPELGSDIIKNKVSSSIAHMYERPRTWLEGFYGSGWGTSSGDVADAVFRNFAMGHNLLSLHGMYYSTYGSMWEWAPPCNHHHMPYWEHMKEFLGATERLSYLMSQGHHVCDVAIIYPVAAVEGGLEGDKAVETAFRVGEYLYPRGVDFDFIDFESIDRAEIKDGKLCVAQEAFKVLVVPAMQTIRFSTILKMKEFVEQGGNVVFVGALPIASDHAGRNDEVLDTIIQSIVTKGAVVNEAEEVYEFIHNQGSRDFYAECSAQRPQYMLHRKIQQYDVYMIYGIPKDTPCYLRSKGEVQLWDIYTGTIKVIGAAETEEGIKVILPLESTEVNLIVIDTTKAIQTLAMHEVDTPVQLIKVEGEWECELKPTLDNQYGDYRLPAFKGYLGAEARQFQFKQLDEENWKPYTYSYGTYFWKLGPLSELPDESQLIHLTQVDKKQGFVPYQFSMKMGIEGDAGDQGSYHGLKGKVTDEFIALGHKELTKANSSSVYTEEEEGHIYYLFTTVYCEEATKVHLKMGNKKPDKLWINHQETAVESSDWINLEKGNNPILLRYDSPGRTYFVVEKAEKEEFEQHIPLAMNWYRNPNILPFDAMPQYAHTDGWIKFNTPPGMKSMQVKSYGQVECWIGDEALAYTMDDAEGLISYNFSCEEPFQKTQEVKMKVTQARGQYNGAAVEEVITFECEKGMIEFGDWSQNDALKCYSGGIWYRRNMVFKNLEGKYILDMGQVVSSAEVHVNGACVGIKVSPPFKMDITDYLVEGENRIEILVYNTLSNHYVTIPSNYKGRYVAEVNII